MKNTSLLLFLGLFITACGGGGTSNSSNSSQSTGFAATKFIEISWDIPTKRDDNETLLPASEIGGFNIYITTNNSFIPSIPHATVIDSSISNLTIYNLLPGTYYIYVTTYDTNGDESKYSSQSVKIV